jgi:hypothetical protein
VVQSVRLSAEKFAVIEEIAERAGVPVSALIRGSQFQSFPGACRGVGRVEQRAGSLIHWVTGIGGSGVSSMP